MKTNQFIIALWLMAAGIALSPRTGLAKPLAPASAADPSTFEQELANYLQAVQLRNALERGAVVVVSFSLDKQQRVQNTTVYTQDETLKATIQRSLKRKKIHSLNPTTESTDGRYMMRLHLSTAA